MAKLRSYVDDNFSGRDWNLASAMVIEGKAGMQIMGDWAKGEFVKANQKPGVGLRLHPLPRHAGRGDLQLRQFMMFKVGDDKQDAQLKMATDIEDPAFQSSFNVVKGSVPARTDVPDTAFDDCGKKGIKDLAEASAKGTLYGSMAHGHASPAAVKNAMYDVITREFNGEHRRRGGGEGAR